MSRALRPIVVLQSFPEPRATTNPYIVMLKRALERTPGLTVKTFSWSEALTGRYDVFHVHWPEILLEGRTPVRRAFKASLFVLLLLKLAVSRTAIVRTQHNLELPSDIGKIRVALLRILNRATTIRIALNDQTFARGATSCAVIPHGHYRDWFAPYIRSRTRSATFGYVGLIRRYKNVTGLVAAFRRLPGDFTLEVAGRPSDDRLRDSLQLAADGDPRIALRLGFLDDEDLVLAVSGCELVVLPYSHMHNSGGVLASLSLSTPVLVPATEVNAALAKEVGAGWVLQYEGVLTPTDLLEALEVVRERPRSSEPDLSARGWDDAGQAHLSVYRDALTRVGRLYSS